MHRAIKGGFLLVAIGLAFMMMFELADSQGVRVAAVDVTVVEKKEIHPFQWLPLAHSLHFKLGGDKYSIFIDKKFFESVEVGDRVQVAYGFGRVTDFGKPMRIGLVE